MSSIDHIIKQVHALNWRINISAQSEQSVNQASRFQVQISDGVETATGEGHSVGHALKLALSHHEQVTGYELGISGAEHLVDHL